MKAVVFYALFTFGLCTVFIAPTQIAKTEPTILERGAHHRVVQTPSGGIYTEIANGMHYLEDGKWVESKELIELDKEGAVARQGPNKVTFAANINSPVAITMTAPDGKQFKTRVMGLVYYDAFTGGNVLIAELKDSVGSLISSNQVLYPDAFTDFEADIRYTYLKDSFEQDVILRKNPPPPEKYGLDSSSARLQLWTEVFDPPQVEKQTATIRKEDDDVLRDVMVAPDFTDDLLAFGVTQVGRGKAFSVDSEILRNLDIDAAKVVAVGKEWLPNIDGRSFLVESVEYPDAKAFLDTLPEALGANIQQKIDAQRAALRQNDGLTRAEFVRLLPKPKAADSNPAIGPKMMMARADAPKKPGFTIDYTSVASQSDMTFKSDTTYFVSAAVTLSGTNTLEGGTVVKFDRPSYYVQPQITISGTSAKLACSTSAYRPAILTGKDDNTVGEAIYGSSGSPSGTYALNALVLNTSSPSTPVELSHLRIAYAQTAISLYGTGNLLRHAQMVSCGTGINLAAYGEAKLRNVLICYTPTVLAGFQGSLRAENVTVDQASYLNGGYYSHSVTLTLTNCLLTSVYDVGPYTGTPNAVNPSGTIYQTVGAGNHYLANSSTNRGAGVATIDAGLLADLRTRTSYPPEVRTSFSTPIEVLQPRLIRDNQNPNAVDLGYHYATLDYAWSGVSLSSSLLLTNGVAVAVYGTTGTTLQSGASFTSAGLPTSMNRLLRHQAVQEMSAVWGSSGSTMSLINIAAANSPLPVVSLRFTDISLLADAATKRYLFENANSYLVDTLSFRDCELRNGYLSLARNTTDSTPMTVALTNNLAQRVTFSFTQPTQPLAVYLWNNTFLAGSLSLQGGTQLAPWVVRDNLFDTVTLSANGAVPNSYNCYISTTTLPNSGGGDRTITTRDYQTGPLGTNYLPTTGGQLSTLINAGSRTADQAGLYHYATTPNQIKDGNSVVDIGAHFMVLGQNNLPVDSDLDGLPDYVEDSNGNGLLDASETSFTNPDTDGDGFSDYTEMYVLKSDPLDAYSLNRRANGRARFTDCQWLCTAPIPGADYVAGDTQAKLTLQSANSQTIQLVLSGAPADSTWDIYFSWIVINNATPWTLYYRGSPGQVVFNVPNPGGATGFFTAGSAADIDGDGLSDGYEILVTYTSPGFRDTGNTGVPDGDKDIDGDGLTNLEEYNLGFDPKQPNVGSITFNPVGGNFSSPQSVTITCPTVGASIHYTLNGQEPTESDLVIASGAAITVDHSLTLKAKAWKTAWTPSDVEAESYYIGATPNNQPPTLSISPNASTTFLASDDIAILIEASDSDGTVTKIQLFRGGFKIAETSTSPLQYLSRNVPAGTYAFTAKAIDSSGAVTTSPFIITVNAPGPVVTLQGAQLYYRSSPGLLFANVLGVNQAGLTTLTLNGNPVPLNTGDFPLSVNLAEGENTFTLVATDSQNRTGQATTKVYLDTISPAIAISSPLANSSFNTARINVLGTFTEASLKRISVNGFDAFISGSSFQALNVPLAAGANAITAVAEDLAGNLGSAAITVTGIPDGNGNLTDPVQLTANPIAGFVPVNVTFSPQAAVPGTLQQVLYDFEGDNVIDLTRTDILPISHTYSSSGEYFPIVTIVTSSGQFSSQGGWKAFANALKINVQSPPLQTSPLAVTDPVDLKWTTGGYLYVLSRSGASITEYDSGYTVIRSITGIGSSPSGLDVDSDGNVYVALSGDNQVKKYAPINTTFQLDTTFNSTGSIGKSDRTTGSGNGEFNTPFDVAVSPDGGVIAVSDSGNHRIQRFVANGLFLDVFGQQGNAIGQFNTPRGLIYDDAGLLYVVDSGNNRIVLAYPEIGAGIIGVSGTMGTALGQLQGAVNLSVGSRGIHVAEAGNNRIQIFDPIISERSSSPLSPRLALSTELGLNSPNSVAVVNDLLQHKIYVADTANNRVLLITLPVTTPAPVWNAMKQRLLAGDVQGALPYFSSISADNYRTAFNSIGTTDLSSMIGQIGAITPVFIQNDTAQYRFDQVIDAITITFPITFVMENGTWKIQEF
ncbi:MAG TPA: chitobiase/beta-hexosaminidase C-terminal domain-containing protein [Terriglobales bacterium]